MKIMSVDYIYQIKMNLQGRKVRLGWVRKTVVEMEMREDLKSISIEHWKVLFIRVTITGAGIDQWIRLLLPSWGPGFDVHVQHLAMLFNLYLNCDEKKDGNKQNRGRYWPIFQTGALQYKACLVYNIVGTIVSGQSYKRWVIVVTLRL